MTATGRRVEGWEGRLDRVIKDWRDKPFSWERRNCGRLMCEAVAALTGSPPKGIRPAELDSRAACARAVGAWGRSLSGAADALLAANGLDRVPPRLASRGDIALGANGDGTEALGVVVGSTAAFPGEEGLKFVPVSELTATWRVA